MVNEMKTNKVVKLLEAGEVLERGFYGWKIGNKLIADSVISILDSKGIITYAGDDKFRIMPELVQTTHEETKRLSWG